MRKVEYFADFNNFVAFGEFVSIDLRVKVRSLISGKVVKTFSVNTKLPEYTLQTGMYSEICDALDKCVQDLVMLINGEGFLSLGEQLKDKWESGNQRYGDGAAETMAYAIGVLFALNHNWGTGSSIYFERQDGPL